MRIFLDLHIHTNSSPDSTITLNQLVNELFRTGINVIAITDHETMEGYKRIKNSSFFKELLVIPGIEITTTLGDIIILGLENPPIIKDPYLLLDEVKKEGGFILAPHPFDNKRKSLGSLCAKLRVDFIEVYNGRSDAQANKEAREFATALKMKMVGGSDAHRKEEIGSVINVLECEKNIDDIFNSLMKSCKIIVKKR
jgi:predicted metal-dependent phosphoesterase TrpH